MFKQYKDTPYDIYDDGSCYSHLSNKFLTPKMTTKYPTYNLTINGKKKQVKIHRMVAETFLPKDSDPEKNVVHHKDGNTKNYNLSNLQWVNLKENSRYAKALNSVGIGLIDKCAEIVLEADEEWRTIPDYSNYLVSSYGKVMNKNTKKILKPYADNAGGYLCVNLWQNNKSKIHSIHQLVYKVFYNDNDLDGYVINHIDGVKINNNYKNLEKITYQENNLHAVYTIKTNHSNKPVLQLDDNYNIINEFLSITQAQKILNISNISRAIAKKGKAGGYYWEFK